ncbi:TetR/AcrR family transcriptional regulator [Mycolicibacillus parakoreensis]|nr:TetR/AcrR family transcriptional regulator [Mycolicibacillus parakoreensis]
MTKVSIRNARASRTGREEREPGDLRRSIPPPEFRQQRGRRGPATDSQERILAATATVLSAKGTTKLNMSDVAAEAGLSRMTLYRFFSSKEALIDAFNIWEHDLLEARLTAATAGQRGIERLETTLRFLVDYQLSYSGARMLDLEPGQVLQRMTALMPTLRERLERIIPSPDPTMAAAAVIRLVVSHYVVRGDDDDQFLQQLRYVAGLTSQLADTAQCRNRQEARRKAGPGKGDPTADSDGSPPAVGPSPSTYAYGRAVHRDE